MTGEQEVWVDQQKTKAAEGELSSPTPTEAENEEGYLGRNKSKYLGHR